VTEINIDVHHITRVEGHGNIVLNAKEGKIEELSSVADLMKMFPSSPPESAVSALFPIPPVRYKPPRLPSASSHQSRHCCYVNSYIMPRH